MGSARGEIYDAAGKPLVQNTVTKLFPLTKQQDDLKDISKKIVGLRNSYFQS